MTKQIASFEQSQTLTLTSSMHQSLSILQMSNMELAEFAAEELDKNPFIEDDNITVESSEPKKEQNDKEKICQTELRQTDLGPTTVRGKDYSSQDYLANIATEKSLKEHITEQINLSFNDSKDKIIAYYLLDSMLSTGYLGITLNEAAIMLRCDEKIIVRVLKTLQNFDPVGIFARNLRECLTIQLQNQEDTDYALLTMVQNIDLIATGNFKKLAKLCGIDIANIGEMIKKIKSLNPKPANGFFFEQTSYKIPDVILTFTNDEHVKLETNTESMPRLRVNLEYYLKIKNTVEKKEERHFAKTEVESANAIVKSIRQRSQTILKISKAITEQQMDFFTRGVMYLKPMTLNEIAAITGFNESTISRSTANKYISTPTGIFELKYFFSSSLGTTRSASDNVSSTKVKEIIKQIIASEEDGEILSDDEISEQLSKFNISIARRTVAKYREAIGLPSSSIRKRNKQMA
ncbi:MAG: RNA polymerase sigma-54 factor [Rickettsiales bacterium]|nr:MAG: RNA polymerase sigma-54 factor [Rickettsiales bacterium]